MNNFLKFGKALRALCGEEYTHKDVLLVVEMFCNETKSLLYYQETLGWNLRGEWIMENDELTDLALDFIAPLFTRDETGAFIELKRYFDPYLTLPDGALREALYRLLNSVVHQETVRLFQERDPIGKIFYRSLRYVLSKHPDWEKIETRHYGFVIRNKTNSNAEVSQDEMEKSLHNSYSGSLSLTGFVESGLRELIDLKNLTVPVQSLLTIVRRQFNAERNREILSVINEDPSMHLSLQRLIIKTIEEIDRKILRRYVECKKLNPRERQGFKQAIATILRDFIDSDVQSTYYHYLSTSLCEIKSRDEYQLKYRKQFEYVAKLAKKTFSANLKYDFRL